jgi:hypothetical protein
MITGFGNNTASALASDITAGQTSFAVVPGSGAAFAKLLTTDISNPSSPHQVYAKLTLTDSQQTVFEICHLTAVTNDTLTVIRGQEGTTAKGWALNDVIANFATRGSEQSFVQIEQLQGGDYTTATAGGTPNALAISLPSTFQNNSTNDWLLKSPLSITPIAANSGAATLQITLGGKVIGTFPLYKGNKAQLDSGDLLASVPFICVLDSTKTFFTVINPVKIYSKLGTAAYSDVQTSKDDVTPGRVLVNGSAIAVRSVNASGEAGGDVTDANNLPANSVSFVYASATNSPGFESTLLNVSGLGGDYNIQLAASYTRSGLVKLRTQNGDNKAWNNWTTFYTTENKPTAQDTGAVPIAGGNVGYLEESDHYYTKRNQAPNGTGSLAGQLDSGAPFYAPEWSWAPGPGGAYCPIVKGKVVRTGQGFYSAISLGYLLAEAQGFASPVISICGDGGFSTYWLFNAQTGGFSSSVMGEFSSQTDAQNRANDAYNRAIQMASQGDSGVQTWVNGNFCTIAQRDAINNRLAVIESNYVRDVSLGAQGSFIVNNPVTCPAGCVMTGWYTEGQNPGGDTIYYRSVIKNVNGIGYVVSQA